MYGLSGKGRCVANDDTQKAIIAELFESDVAVFGSLLYFKQHLI